MDRFVIGLFDVMANPLVAGLGKSEMVVIVLILLTDVSTQPHRISECAKHPLESTITK